MIFRQEMIKDVIPILSCKIRLMQWDIETIGHRLGVLQILFGGAVLAAVILFPVFHEEAFDLIARLL